MNDATRNASKKPLETLFRSMYHDKVEFAEFVTSPINENYSSFVHHERNKTRMILKPNKKLKIFHTFLNLFLFEHLPINRRVVFSYRKGFSAYDAVAPHTSSRHFFQTDINNFFSSIDRSLVHKTIELGKENAPISDVDFYLERILDIVCIDEVLSPGLPASPVLSNSVLHAFDNAVEEYCKSIGCVYTRYSDDIIISGAAREPLETLRPVLNEQLEKIYGERFSLNERKSKLFDTGGKINILGLTILPNHRISIDAKVRSQAEVLLHFYLTDKERFAKMSQGDMDKGIERVSGFLNYVNSSDKAYLDKLRRRYGATTVDKFLYRSFE